MKRSRPLCASLTPPAAHSKPSADSTAPPTSIRGEGGKTAKPQARHVGMPPQSRSRVHADDKTRREEKKPAHPGPVGVHSRASSKASASPDSSSASSNKPRAVSRPQPAASVVDGEDGKIWLKPAAGDEAPPEAVEHETKRTEEPEKEEAAPVAVPPPAEAESAAPPVAAIEQPKMVKDEDVAVEEGEEAGEIEDKDVGREKEPPSESPVATNGEKKDVVRPNSLPPMNGVDLPDDKLGNKSYPSDYSDLFTREIEQ